VILYFPEGESMRQRAAIILASLTLFSAIIFISEAAQAGWAGLQTPADTPAAGTAAVTLEPTSPPVTAFPTSSIASIPTTTSQPITDTSSLTVTSEPTSFPSTSIPTAAGASTTEPSSTPLPPIFEIQPRQVARSMAPKLINTILILLSAWLVGSIARRMVIFLLARLHPDIKVFIARLVYISIWIAAILWVLSVLNVQVATLATILGSVGLALGLASQDLIKNFIAGVYLLIEHPFTVGDEITVGTYTGKVEFIDMRTTMLLSQDNKRVIVPNTYILSQIVVKNLDLKNTPEMPPEDKG
jgi:hypothetical protein